MKTPAKEVLTIAITVVFILAAMIYGILEQKRCSSAGKNAAIGFFQAECVDSSWKAPRRGER